MFHCPQVSKQGLQWCDVSSRYINALIMPFFFMDTFSIESNVPSIPLVQRQSCIGEVLRKSPPSHNTSSKQMQRESKGFLAQIAWLLFAMEQDSNFQNMKDPWKFGFVALYHLIKLSRMCVSVEGTISEVKALGRCLKFPHLDSKRSLQHVPVHSGSIAQSIVA